MNASSNCTSTLESAIGWEKNIFLFMPRDSKWADKALLIQEYFRNMHKLQISIVDELPQESGVLISLEKDHLISAVQEIKHGNLHLEALLLDDPTLYSTMDDKAESSWRQLPADGMCFQEIPTFNMMTADNQSLANFLTAHSCFEHFMLKPSDEAASVGQEVLSTQDMKEFAKYLGRPYIAQPFFKHHKILTIDFVAIAGDVKGHHCFYVDGPIQNSHWKQGLYQQVLCNASPKILEEFKKIEALTHSLSRSLCLNGIFEIEFLYDGSQAFFLELNLLPGLYGIDEQGLMPVLEQVVVPYLQHFEVDIAPRTDFVFAEAGQFYPPSGTSAPYYVKGFGIASDLENDDDEVSTMANVESKAPSDQSSDVEVLEKPVFLFMPADSKWSDKALLIQDYFRTMHKLQISIVDEMPQESGVLISLEKDHLISAVQEIKHGNLHLEALLLDDPTLYSTMDDKAESSWRQLPADRMCFQEIPTFNMMTADNQSLANFLTAHSCFEHFMLKPSDEAASVGQEVLSTQDMKEFAKYLGRPYIAQPFFKHHKILTIDFVAIAGDVKGHHCFYVDGPIQNSHWKQGLYQQVLCNASPKILEEFQKIEALTHSLSRSLCLNGIFEIEFLYDGSQAFFLELNLLPGLYGIDEQGLMPVLEQVVVPYLQHFEVDIAPRTDFVFAEAGQFYPPSGTSAP